MVYQHYALELSYRKVAENLNVDPSTVQHTIQLFEATGAFSKTEYPIGQPSLQKAYADRRVPYLRTSD